MDKALRMKKIDLSTKQNEFLEKQLAYLSIKVVKRAEQKMRLVFIEK